MQISSLIAPLFIISGVAKNAFGIQASDSHAFKNIGRQNQFGHTNDGIELSKEEQFNKPLYEVVQKDKLNTYQNNLIKETRSYSNGMIQDGTFDPVTGELIAGIQRFPSGTVTKGSYKNGYLDGPNGQITHQDGIIETGTFSQGTRIDGQIFWPPGLLFPDPIEDGVRPLSQLNG